jgi:hypothetical protein
MKKLDVNGNHMNTNIFINTEGISLAVQNLIPPNSLALYLIDNPAYQFQKKHKHFQQTIQQMNLTCTGRSPSTTLPSYFLASSNATRNSEPGKTSSLSATLDKKKNKS